MRTFASSGVLTQLLWGFVAATVALVTLLIVTLLLQQPGYFEWGGGPELGLAFGVTAAAYTAGAGLLLLAFAVCRAFGVPVRLSFTLFGVVLVVTTWALADVPVVKDIRAQLCSSAWTPVLGTIVACVATVAAGIVGLRGASDSGTAR